MLIVCGLLLATIPSIAAHSAWFGAFMAGWGIGSILWKMLKAGGEIKC